MHKFNWEALKSNFPPSVIRELAAERGVKEMTIEGQRTRGWIGQYSKCVAFPISDQNGEVYRAHCRNSKRNAAGKWGWFYEPIVDPEARPIPALVLGNFETASRIYPFESQWDAISLIDKLELFAEIDAGELCLICTRGAKGYSCLAKFPWPPDPAAGVSVYAFGQNDEAGRDWLEHVIQITGGAYAVATPAAYNDLGEWCKDGQASAYDIEAAMDAAELRKPAARTGGAASGNGEQPPREPYKPRGNTPIGHRKRGVIPGEIVLGDGFLELGTAALLAGSSGIGKSSIAMQMGCCWSCGKPAFYLEVPRPLRIVMIQNEDSDNDLARQSEVITHLGVDENLIEKNFWIETVRGKIGGDAVLVMRDLVKWWRAELLMINPLSAYHAGDISSNKDNIAFLYGELGRLLDEKVCAIFGFHHKGKPPKTNGKKPEDVYFEIMYDILGGSTLTNFFRGLIAVSPIGNSEVFKFALAKRFKESGWPAKFEMFKWHEDPAKYLWVPASFAEADKAKGSGKAIEDLRKLIPVLGSIPKPTLEMEAMRSGFTRPTYRGVLAQALDDSTPDDQRLYQWAIYNPRGVPFA
jgi:hypothetical protein